MHIHAGAHAHVPRRTHTPAGAVSHGLQYTPCGKYVVYPLGTMVVVRNLSSDAQAFLEGHNNAVSTLAISHDGKRLASGELGLTPGTKVRRICSMLLCSCAHIHVRERAGGVKWTWHVGRGGQAGAYKRGDVFRHTGLHQ
jgi:hypothetical protein